MTWIYFKPSFSVVVQEVCFYKASLSQHSVSFRIVLCLLLSPSMFQYCGEKEAYWQRHNTFSLQFHVGKKMEENVKTLTPFPMHEYSWLTCVINIRIGQAVFLRKKAYTPTRIISERIHHGNIWVSACQESGLNRLTHYTNCVFHSIVFIVCTNYRDITKIRCPQLFQLGNSTYWFFIWIWFQFRNVSSGCNFSSF